MTHRHRLLFVIICCCFAVTSHALDLVSEGKAHATIVIAPEAKPAPARARGPKNQPKRIGTPGDAMAAQVLAEWIKKITGAEIPIATEAPKDSTPIYVGAAAIKAGLNLDDID